MPGRLAAALVLVVVSAVLALCGTPRTATAAGAAAQTMHRLYNRYTGEHFYTASTKERDSLKSVGWTYEGTGWTAPKSSKTPVYRLYNPYVKGGDHHYTVSAKERDTLRTAGWRYEGVGWYSDDAKAVPLYRQYNPYAVTGTHNYTTSKKENDHLLSVGWKYEGIAWYGVKAGGSSSGSTKPSAGNGSTSKPSNGNNSASKPSGNNGATSKPNGGQGGAASKPNAGSKVKYSYQLYYLDGAGNNWYTGVTRLIYVKTNNPGPDFYIGSEDSSVKLVTSVSPSGCYADIADQGQVDNFLKVPGGYVVGYNADEASGAGNKKLTLYEYVNPNNLWEGAVAAGNFTVNIIDYDTAVSQWVDTTIKRFGKPSMTVPQKMSAIEDGLLAEFKYYPNYNGSYVTLATKPVAPFFNTKTWDSAVSPDALELILAKLGFTDIKHNPSDPYGHAFVFAKYGGKTYWYMACPDASTNTVNPASVPKINFNNMAGFQRIL